MALLIDGERGVNSKPKKKSYTSPVTGKTTDDPSKIPGTPEWKARQDKASSNRYPSGSNSTVTYKGSGGGKKSGGGGSYGANSGGGGGSAASELARLQAKADAERRAAEEKARQQANKQAQSGANQAKSQLQQQIDAALAKKETNKAKLDSLKKLVTDGLKEGLNTGVTGVKNNLSTLLDQAFASFKDTVGDLNTGLRDNEKAEADSSFTNLANRAREKQDAVSQALSMGAGESDVLKTQLQALRNWSSNQADVNRSYFDTLSSTNSAITDLNIGTKSQLTGYEMEANQRLQGIWSDYYSGMADSFTQMDNLATNNYLLDQEIEANKGNMSSQDKLLEWIKSGKDAADFVMPEVKSPSTKLDSDFKGYSDKAAEWAGKVWEDPGVSDATKNFAGQKTQVNNLNTSDPRGAQPLTSGKKRPEGAILRKW